MNCEKCGCLLVENAKFCGKCGAPTIEKKIDQENCVKEKKEKSKLPTIMAIFLLLIILASGVFLWYKFFYYRKIDMNSYLKVEYEGYEGYATACYELDIKGMLRENTKAFNYEELRRSERNELTQNIVDTIKGDLNKIELICNGDELVFQWHVDVAEREKLEEAYHVRFKCSPVSVEVSGLEDLKKVNAFEGINYWFSGFDTRGTVNIDTYDKNYYMFNYIVSKEQGLSNGDVITISLTEGYWDACIAEGIIPERTSMEVEVTGLQGIKSVDPFDGLKVYISGDIPNVSVEFDSSAVIYPWEYKYSPPIVWENGKYITVYITEESKKDCLEYYGVKPKETTKKYYISGLDTLLINPAYDSEAKDFIEEIRQGLMEQVPDTWVTPRALKNVKFVGILYSRPTKHYLSIKDYYTTFLYEFEVQQPGEDPFTYYNFVRFENLKKLESGTITYDSYEYPCKDWFVGVDYFVRNGLWYDGFETFAETCERATNFMDHDTVASLQAGYQYSN